MRSAGDALAALIQREADNPTILGAAMSSLPPHLKASCDMSRKIGRRTLSPLTRYRSVAAKDDAAPRESLFGTRSENERARSCQVSNASTELLTALQSPATPRSTPWRAEAKKQGSPTTSSLLLTSSFPTCRAI